MQGKLRIDRPLIESEEARFIYVFTRLGESPQAIVGAFYNLNIGTPKGTTAEFLQYLTSCYGDPNLA